MSTSGKIVLGTIIAGVLALFVVGALLLSHAGSIMQASIDTPEGKKSFLASFKTSCGYSAKLSSGGRLSAAQIDAYCDCSGTKIVANVKGDDLVQLMTTFNMNSLSPALRQQVAGIVQQCQSAAVHG